MLYRCERRCRSCGADDLRKVLAFGYTPIADRLLRADQVPGGDLRVPLTLAFCVRCSLVQIIETVSPEVLFCENYPYFSSVSKSLVEHFRVSAERIQATRKLGPDKPSHRSCEQRRLHAL